MSGQTAEFLNRYITSFNNLKGIIIADNQGIHVCSSFQNQYKNQSQKLIQTSVLLIQALNQTDNNLQKIHSNNLMKVVNYYFGDYLIHILKEKNLKITLIFLKNSTIMRAKQISTDIAKAYQTLNNKIPEIKRDS